MFERQDKEVSLILNKIQNSFTTISRPQLLQGVSCIFSGLTTLSPEIAETATDLVFVFMNEWEIKHPEEKKITAGEVRNSVDLLNQMIHRSKQRRRKRR